ncbi:helix-turn-helix transcriptional regulator [Halomarina halobia]|uniref:Helix-turn-helix transcriptional regulator n=1 Tax=Halomarina halobia TaxID=3033386 RepID=A0ABD6ADW6_9EURY|nr:transcriptional regulator FilR1 domain-containing protein [Halomarina sp. PSR21]
MESTLEEIEFLALSRNRVDVLALLAERPRTRRELVELTGASQPTLGRILGDFEDRAWVVREGGEYAVTATGRLVATGFGDLIEIMETERRLRTIVRWLPTDALTFDLRHLSAATITVPSQVRPNAPVTRALDLLRDAAEVSIFSYAFNEQSLDVVRERTATGEQRFRGVFSASAIDALADDDQLRRRLRDLLTSEGAEIRITDEEIPLAATVADGSVHLFLRDGSGVLRASIDTDDATVRSWAEESFERYWRTATPLDLGTL